MLRSVLITSLLIGSTVVAENPRPRSVLDLFPPKRATLEAPHPHEGVVLVRTVLSDNGDDDGWADTNETVTMRLMLYNRIGVDLTGVTAHLVPLNDVTSCISHAAIPVGELANGETRLTATGFVFLVRDLNRTGLDDDFSAKFEIEIASNEKGVHAERLRATLDLDLDISGGGMQTQFFEGFEQGLGAFEPVPLDDQLNAPPDDLGNHEAALMNADGYRCQYNDLDWERSQTHESPQAQFCYPNPVGQPDAFWWDTSQDRAFSGASSLRWGVTLDAPLGFSTPVGQMEGVQTSAPISLGFRKTCVGGIGAGTCEVDEDCTFGASCLPSAPTLSFKHQISLIDHRIGGRPGRSLERGLVQAQVVDDGGQPLGHWIKLDPFINGYDSQDDNILIDCTFDPIDDGNTEEDFFDPTDPARLHGPSSSCYPERIFAHQGDTDSPFDAESIGDASDGPGLEGASGIGTWVLSVFDLSRLRGRQVRIRLLGTGIKASDSSQTTYEELFQFNPDPRDDGWWADDVTIADALSSPATVVVDWKDNLDIKDDFDLDDVGATCDCAPDDADAWELPHAAEGLVMSQSETVSRLEWLPPANLGGNFVTYDVLRSSNPANFESAEFATCTSTRPDETTATDAEIPQLNSVSYYLVGAANVCGTGSLGRTSAGVERVGTSCP